MSSNDDVWLEVARRAAVSRFSGATADDDDVVAAADLGEALLNPNRSNQGGGAMAGGPGMMPPMMMGGMGRGGSESGSVPPSLGAAGGAAVMPGPGPAGGGVGMVKPEVVAAEAAPGVGEEGLGETPGLPGMPSMPGAGSGGAGTGGLPGGGAGGAGDGSGAGGMGSASGVGGAAPADGFSADPVAVRDLGSKWAELAQEMHIHATPSGDASLGVAAMAERPAQALLESIDTWTTGAAKEFDALVTRLHDVAGQYEAVEEAGVVEARKGAVQ